MPDDRIKSPGIRSKGYGLIPKMVMQDKELHITSKAIYAYFCSYTGSGDTCFPSRGRICEDLGIAADTYQKYLGQLVKNGYLAVEQVRKDGRFSHNVYTVLQEKSPCTETTVTENTGHGELDTNITSFPNSNTSSCNSNSFLSPPYSPPRGERAEAEETDVDTETALVIVDYLNRMSGKKYRLVDKTKKLISARMREGFTVDDFKTVIEKKCRDWKDGDFDKYLRPVTLFGTKFEGYLNQPDKMTSGDGWDYIQAVAEGRAE